MNVKSLALAAAAAGSFALSGCAVVRNEAVSGSLFLDVTQPDMVTENTGLTKRGTSSATTILGWVGTGDCSVGAAAKAAGITKITAVDYHSKQILGIFGDTTTIVYGE
ncbi:MAG: hypothetical protein RLZZ127_2846 [Planctomycetota bacterium]|jgi:hypothetical protein